MSFGHRPLPAVSRQMPTWAGGGRAADACPRSSVGPRNHPRKATIRTAGDPLAETGARHRNLTRAVPTGAHPHKATAHAARRGDARRAVRILEAQGSGSGSSTRLGLDLEAASRPQGQPHRNHPAQFHHDPRSHPREAITRTAGAPSAGTPARKPPRTATSVRTCAAPGPPPASRTGTGRRARRPPPAAPAHGPAPRCRRARRVRRPRTPCAGPRPAGATG
ncbi:hypothetical protein DFR72_113159 [Lentzea flaviverrucosa]|uniref:Uncharacterized protein n=1 Tax=Lentzea flaviverrucosa TaxID=200379 RepID=A0A1H9XC02_9PSEU|nr:hypothetical protein DFR72_113159 [Lentzea flaviverrucosa]SES43716.1 hypothetical protein SAMN05216195_114120 [Lentzea flaviverrucosa]